MTKSMSTQQMTRPWWLCHNRAHHVCVQCSKLHVQDAGSCASTFFLRPLTLLVFFLVPGTHGAACTPGCVQGVCEASARRPTDGDGDGD